MARLRKGDLTNLPDGGIVRMHNTLISASHGLSLGEKRLVSMAVAKLSSKAAALPGKPIKIAAQDFADQFGIEDHVAYRELRAAQENLFHRYITHIEHRGKNGQQVYVRKMRWVSSIEYEKGGGEVAMSFAPEVAQFLVQLKSTFTKYQLSKAAALRSTYSWRLYENIERFRPTGVWKVDIERFHIIMETPKSYRANFAQVRRWVLEPAISELATQCALRVEVEPEKRGRRIVALTFNFEPIQQMALPLDGPE